MYKDTIFQSLRHEHSALVYAINTTPNFRERRELERQYFEFLEKTINALNGLCIFQEDYEFLNLLKNNYLVECQHREFERRMRE